jgi:regulator of chromosome condensation
MTAPSIVSRVYLWGRALSTAPEPAEVLRLEGDAIADVQAGSKYTLALTASGRVFAWGAGTYGRLGLGSEEDQLAPTCVPFTTRIPIRAIAASNWYTLMVSHRGELYCCGKFGGASILTPAVVPRLPPVLSCAAGDRCFAVVAGHPGGPPGVYVVGSSLAAMNALFPPDVPITGPHDAWCSVRVPLPTASAVTGIVLRGQSFLALCADGLTYAWGANTSRCLGVDDKAAHVWPPAPVVMAGLAAPLAAASLSPGHINAHSLFLLADGSVCGAGSNYKFKTGIPSGSTRQNNTHSCECIAPPRPVPFFSAAAAEGAPRVTHVACGALHSLAVTDDGRLFLWGCGSDGRLGFPEYRAKRARYLYHERTPRQLSSLRGRVTAAHTYWWHTVAATVEPASAEAGPPPRALLPRPDPSARGEGGGRAGAGSLVAASEGTGTGSMEDDDEEEDDDTPIDSRAAGVRAPVR